MTHADVQAWLDRYVAGALLLDMPARPRCYRVVLHPIRYNPPDPGG